MSSFRKALRKLPARFQWTVHNVVGHPVSEVLHLLGFAHLSRAVHKATEPADPPKQVNHNPPKTATEGTSGPATAAPHPLVSSKIKFAFLAKIKDVKDGARERVSMHMLRAAKRTSPKTSVDMDQLIENTLSRMSVKRRENKSRAAPQGFGGPGLAGAT